MHVCDLVHLSSNFKQNNNLFRQEDLLVLSLENEEYWKLNMDLLPNLEILHRDGRYGNRHGAGWPVIIYIDSFVRFILMFPINLFSIGQFLIHFNSITNVLLDIILNFI